MKKKLFILEDNEDLVEEVSALAKECGLEVTTARSLDDGIEKALMLCKGAETASIMGIIDLMLPTTNRDLGALDKLLEQREKIIVEGLGKDGQAQREQAEQADRDTRAALTEIDSEIQAVVNIDAGIEFLKQTWESGVEDWRLCFFSSRSRQKLEKAIKAVTRIDLSLRWLQKPVEADAVISQLNEFNNSTI